MARRKLAAFDIARLVAAMLVAANHTSPLTAWSPTADFILTRVVARLAVPLFFLLTGYYVLGGQTAGCADRVRRFAKKTLLLYGLATLLYLPLNIYGGYFTRPDLRGRLFYDLLIGGTFYHLWYFPAVLLGIGIVWALLKKTGPAVGTAVVSALYLVGLGGDNYFGLMDHVAVLKEFYGGLMTVFEYTRNGLFFAPLFLLLGSLAAQRKKPPCRTLCAAGFAVSFGVMVLEALCAARAKIPAHDSMYLLLPAASLGLFGLLRRINSGESRLLRDMSLWFYVLHPLSIAGVRFLARLFSAGWVLENSLLFYAAVCVSSGAAALLAAWLIRKYRGRNKADETRNHTARAWAEVDLAAIRHNARLLQSRMQPGCRLMAVVKADAYGHGAAAAAHTLAAAGVESFAVATLDEAVALRRAGIRGEILVLGYTLPARAAEIKKNNLTQTVCSADYAAELNGRGKALRVHVKIDTGMHRQGEDWRHVRQIESIFECKNLRVEGCYTHLCAADSPRAELRAFTQRQIDRFYVLTDRLKRNGRDPGKLHIQSSYGLANHPQLACDYARIGIFLYGVYSNPQEDVIGLRPALALRARVGCVGMAETGESVGYGCAWQAGHRTRCATVTIGYADGLPRLYADGGARVLIRGQFAPVIGRVCMDQLIVDVTEIPEAKPGDVATLIGCDGENEIRCEEVAARCGTITNEILSRLGKRVAVQYKNL